MGGVLRAGKMAQWVKVLVPKSDELDLIPQTLIVERSTPTSCHLTSVSAWQVCAHTYILIE